MYIYIYNSIVIIIIIIVSLIIVIIAALRCGQSTYQGSAG